MNRYTCSLHPGQPAFHDECEAPGVSWTKIELKTAPESFLDTGYNHAPGEPWGAMDKVLHDASLAHKLKAALKAAEEDHADFLAMMSQALADWPCLHDAKDGHAATPPMMWPELIGCIVSRARLDTARKLLPGLTDQELKAILNRGQHETIPPGGAAPHQQGQA